MRKVIKDPNWKHITFKTSKLNFIPWSKGGIIVIVDDQEYKFETQAELEALHLSLQPSYHNNDSCFITVQELKSIFVKSQERIPQIQLLNGVTYNKPELLSKMYDDSFYYGELGKYALSSSAIKSLLTSPKEYARSLNYKTDSSAFKIGRLIHIAALEPEKLDTLCHVVEVQSSTAKAYKDKVKEVGDASFVFNRKEYDKAMYVADALLQNDVWQDLTRGARFEQPGFDILNGYPFRAKADVIGDGYIADLKTTSDLRGFEWAAKKYGYDVQVYIYCNIFKVDYKDFVFFAIDKGTGDLGIYDVTESFYQSGKEKLERAISIYETYFVHQEEELNTYVIRGTLE